MYEVRVVSSSYACQNCCNISAVGYGISLTFAQVFAGEQISFSAWQNNYDCNGNIYPAILLRQAGRAATMPSQRWAAGLRKQRLEGR
jgi:hypothetical protein